MIKKGCFGAILIFIALSCGNSNTLVSAKQSDDCMQRLIAIDDSLGKIRNRQCMELSLSETIQKYAEAMKTIETQHCPNELVVAYRSHREAWEAMLEVTDNYPNLRGEMHVLFKELEQSNDQVLFKKRLDAIWSTWADVEKFAPK